MIQSRLTFHLLVVPFNTGTPFRLSDQPSPRGVVGGQAGKPEFQGLFVSLRPFNEQFPRRHLHCLALHQPIGHSEDQASKTRRERTFCSFSPRDRLPPPRGQIFTNLAETSSRGKFFRIMAFSRNLPSSFDRRLRRMRIFRPSHQIPTRLNHVTQLPASQPLTELIQNPIKRVRQYLTISQFPLSDFIDQIQKQLWFRLKGDFFWDPSFLSSDGIIDPLLWKIQRPIQRRTRFLAPQIQRYRHLTVGCLSQSATVLPRHPHRALPLLGKRHPLNEAVSLWNKFSLPLSSERRPQFLERPRTLIDKLLQNMNVLITKTICHELDRFTFAVREEGLGCIPQYVVYALCSPWAELHQQPRKRPASTGIVLSSGVSYARTYTNLLLIVNINLASSTKRHRIKTFKAPLEKKRSPS
jgi:hypothetical protein